MLIFSWLVYLTAIQQQEVKEVFLAAFLPQNREPIETYHDYFDKKFIPRFEKGRLVNAVYHEDKMVGFAIFEKWDDESYYLAEMAVIPEFQGQGIGTKLVFSILEKDPSINRILLVTEKKNVWSQAFYNRIGFTPSTFTHPDYPENFIGFEYHR